MDTTATTHLSLCSGYGGIDLGLRRAIPDLRTIAYAEIEAFACENLLARMEGGQLDPAPIWPDLKSFPWGAFSGRVDILSGGYPCQPFSAAGKRLGTEDPRHLWPFIADGIRLLRPRLCFFENVEGHISLGLREVIGELESMGYKVSWGIFSAREVGAPHQRKRVFIMAVTETQYAQGSINGMLWREDREDGIPREHRGSGVPCRTLWPSRPGQPQYAFEPPRVVANTASQRTNRGQQLFSEECGQGRALPIQSNDSGESVGNADSLNRRTSTEGWIDDAEVGSASKASEAEWQVEPAMGGNADGTARGMDYAELSVTCDNRTDELRLLGNGVVPATATLAFQTLLAELLSL
jgi:DNA (cytosine-5)-methyltransferase 1